MTPPAPMIGSAKNAATVSGPSRRISSSSSAAQRVANSSSLSPGFAKLKWLGQEVWRMLAIGRSKSRWFAGRPVRLAVATVTPW